MDAYSDKFIEINSFVRLAAYISLGILTFLLTFAVIPFAEWRLHFFQMGIFVSGFLFGPFAGALVGALSSSYNGLLVLNNPWIIGGNAILGFSAAYLYTRTTPFKAAMGAFAIQLPYLVATNYFFMHMPLSVLGGVVITLFASNILCAFMAANITPNLKAMISRA